MTDKIWAMGWRRNGMCGVTVVNETRGHAWESGFRFERPVPPAILIEAIDRAIKAIAHESSGDRE